MLSEYSSPSDRLNRPAKPALTSLTKAKLQTGKNARAAMKIHHRAIGSTANDLLREDLSPISRLRDNRCFIKYATIRDSRTVINKKIQLSKSRGECFHVQGTAPPSRADLPTETPFFAARIARYISTGSSGLFTDLFAPTGWALLATHPPEIK